MKEEKYQNKQTDLYLKKEKLFETGNRKQWGIDKEEIKKIDYDSLIEDKKTAMKYMLSKETKELETLYQDYGYFLNRILDELNRLSMDNYKNIRAQLIPYMKEFAKMLSKLYKSWINVYQHLNEDMSKNSVAYKEKMIKEINDKVTFGNEKCNFRGSINITRLT